MNTITIFGEAFLSVFLYMVGVVLHSSNFRAKYSLSLFAWWLSFFFGRAALILDKANGDELLNRPENQRLIGWLTEDFWRGGIILIGVAIIIWFVVGLLYDNWEIIKFHVKLSKPISDN